MKIGSSPRFGQRYQFYVEGRPVVRSQQLAELLPKSTAPIKARAQVDLNASPESAQWVQGKHAIISLSLPDFTHNQLLGATLRDAHKFIARLAILKKHSQREQLEMLTQTDLFPAYLLPGLQELTTDPSGPEFQQTVREFYDEGTPLERLNIWT